MNVPLLIVPLERAKRFGRGSKGWGLFLLAIYPGLSYDLKSAGIDIEPEKYALASFFSAMMWGGAFGIFSRVLVALRGIGEPVLTAAPILLAFSFFIFFYFLHIFYPKIIARKVADEINRNLIFAMRDTLIQVSSGVPLYTAMGNIAEGNYGPVSAEFKKVGADMRGGISMTEALENMALRTKSEFLKKASWQLITAVRAGTNIATALRSVIDSLLEYQMRLVKEYNADLNVIVLAYMLVSTVVPTIGITAMVIFSVFGIWAITPEFFLFIVSGSFIVQIMIIGYVYSRRPMVYG